MRYVSVSLKSYTRGRIFIGAFIHSFWQNNRTILGNFVGLWHLCCWILNIYAELYADMWWNFSIYPGWYSNLSRQSVSVSSSLSDFHSVGVLDPYRVFRDHRMLCIFWYGENKLFLISKKCDKFWSRDINFTHGFDPPSKCFGTSKLP